MKLIILAFLLTISVGSFAKTLTNHSAGYDFHLDTFDKRELESYLKEIKKEDIFEFIGLGCQARAHYISNYFDKKGYETGKIIISVNKSVKRDLALTFKGARWDWHISNLVVANVNGTEKVYVVDLSISDKLIPVNKYINILTKEELTPNGASFNITFCPKDCFIEKNKTESLRQVQSYAELNDKLTLKYINIMESFLLERKKSSPSEQRKYFLNNI